MDIRIIDDSFDIDTIAGKMNQFLPEGIRVFSATAPVLDPKYIAFAGYNASISVDEMTACELYDAIIEIQSEDELIIQKKSKAGLKDVDMMPYVKSMEFTSPTGEELEFTVILPAGNTKNIGLPLVLKAISNRLDKEINYKIEKYDMFTEEMKPFE